MICVADEISDPPVRKAIPDEPTFVPATDQTAIQKAAQMVRDIGLTKPCLGNDFLHAGVAETPEELCPRLKGVSCRKIVLNVLQCHIIIH